MHLENLLSRETYEMERTIGDWAVVSNATITHQVRFSVWPESFDSETLGNSAKVVAAGSGDMEIQTGRAPVTAGRLYRGLVWVTPNPGVDLTVIAGVRFYDSNENELSSRELSNTDLDIPDKQAWWPLVSGDEAPPNSVTMELYLIFENAVADDAFWIAWPSILVTDDLWGDFLKFTSFYIPDYILEADAAEDPKSYGTDRPLARYLLMATHSHDNQQDEITAWDYVRPPETDDGIADTSSLVDPFKVNAEWLPWLAQLMGVSLDTIPFGGRSPWLAFEAAGIDTWTEWEEDIDPLSIPGIPDTEWVDIETYSPEFFDTETARRLQISAGFNGVLGGTAGSIISYVGALLNTEEEDPFVYVYKHYGTNPYRILVSVLEIEDPDPTGDLLAQVVQAATPAGTDVTKSHGVRATAKTYYFAQDFFRNAADNFAYGGSRLPLRFFENGAANGRNLTFSTVTGSNEPFYGGGIGLARWFVGYAAYSGAVQVRTAAHSTFNINDDIDFRILVSNGVEPFSGNSLLLAKSDDKWALYAEDDGTIRVDWENSGTQSITTDAPINWGNADTRPFWLRFVIDINNGAAGTDVLVYTSPTLYEDAWGQVGTTQTVAGVGIDLSGNANLQIFDNDTSADAGMSVFFYRAMLHAGIEGTIQADLNLTGEFSPATDLLTTGTEFFRFPITTIQIFVEPVAIDGTNMVDTPILANNQSGRDDYWYIGHSPFSFEGGTASLGDTLVVTGLPSDSYDWTITRIDGTLIQGNTGGGTTSITFDSDDHGGESILNILVREDTGQTLQALFLPDLLAGNTTVAVDGQSRTWTLTRSFETGEYYEYSSFVDRDHIQLSGGDGVFTSGVFFDADSTLTVAVAVRRFWSGSGVTTIVDHTTTSGWKLQYNGDNIEAIVTDGTSPITLTADEVTPGLVGVFNLITLRRDLVNGEISLWLNDVKTDSIADPWVNGNLFSTIGNSGTVGDPGATKNFDKRYLGIFERALSDGHITLLSEEAARLLSLLPQPSQSTFPPLLDASATVATPAFDITWYVDVPLLDASPTLFQPQMNQVLLIPHFFATPTIHIPRTNYLLPPTLDASPTFYDPDVSIP